MSSHPREDEYEERDHHSSKMNDFKPLSLLVRNLHFSTSPDRVRKFFEQYGEVRDVYLPLDFYTRTPRGFGFVEFARESDAEAALQSLSRDAVLDGAEISVTIAQQGRKSPDTMRTRDRPFPRGGRRDDRRDYRRDDREGYGGRDRGGYSHRDRDAGGFGNRDGYGGRDRDGYGGRDGGPYRRGRSRSFSPRRRCRSRSGSRGRPERSYRGRCEEEHRNRRKEDGSEPKDRRRERYSDGDAHCMKNEMKPEVLSKPEEATIKQKMTRERSRTPSRSPTPRYNRSRSQSPVDH